MSVFEPRKIRCFSIYKSQHLVLTVADESGRLFSTAAPPPEGAPAHPFVNARAYDPFSENELGWYLQKSTSFDNFIGQLIQAGYDVASQTGSPPTEMTDASRLEDKTGLAGVVWSTGGQFTMLSRQPEPDTYRFAQATLTAYRDDCSDVFMTALEKTSTFSKLEASLQASGFRLIRIEKYTL
jgi:hypothetical protein